MTTKSKNTGATNLHGNGKGAASKPSARAAKNELVTIEEVGQSLKNGIVRSLSGINTIETDIVALVRKTVSETMRAEGAAAGELVNVVHHVVMGAIHAAEQVGSGMTTSIRNVAKGIVMGVHDVGGDVISASTETMRSVIKHAATVGADVGTVAKHAMDGTLEATSDIGGNVAHVGKNLIEGAIKEAGKISELTMKTVKEVLSSVAAGTSSGDGKGSAEQQHGAAKKQHEESGRISH
jgi:phage-related protein